VIDTLIRARYVSSALLLLALCGLLAFGRHVEYEQSITSFFADNDPDVLAYRRCATTFGNDNLVFIAYDDPELLTPAGIGRVEELAAAVGPASIPAVVGVQSLDAMPLLWRIDDELLRLEKLPKFMRRLAVGIAQTLVKDLAARGSPLTVGGAVRRASPEALADLRSRITAQALFEGTVVDKRGTSTAVVVRLKGMAEQDPKQTIAMLREAADRFVSRHRLGPAALVGPPVLLADEEGSRRGWRRYFTGLATRSRVVQVCVVALALALFILMKKFTASR